MVRSGAEKDDCDESCDRSEPPPVAGRIQYQQRKIMMKKVNDLRRDALRGARHAADLRQVALGLMKRAEELQRRSDALMRDVKRLTIRPL